LRWCSRCVRGRRRRRRRRRRLTDTEHLPFYRSREKRTLSLSLFLVSSINSACCANWRKIDDFQIPHIAFDTRALATCARLPLLSEK
jgi:hypothetical protein